MTKPGPAIPSCVARRGLMGLFRSASLRWELSLALVLKIFLLVGLWFVIFRYPDSKPQANIADRFQLPLYPSSSSEASHVRR